MSGRTAAAAPAGCRRKSSAATASTWRSSRRQARRRALRCRRCASWSAWRTRTCAMRLSYTLLIPAQGDRASAASACGRIGLAVLTLRKIAATPGFTAGAQVKVSRSAVAMTRISTNIAVRSDWMLQAPVRARRARAAARACRRRAPPSRPALPACAGPSRDIRTCGARPVPLERGARRSEGRSAL